MAQLERLESSESGRQTTRLDTGISLSVPNRPESVNLVDVNPDQAMLFAWSYQAGNQLPTRIDVNPGRSLTNSNNLNPIG